MLFFGEAVRACLAEEIIMCASDEGRLEEVQEKSIKKDG